MNVRLYDGSVRCGEHMDASSYASMTNDPCAYCPQEEDHGFAEDSAVIANTMCMHKGCGERARKLDDSWFGSHCAEHEDHGFKEVPAAEPVDAEAAEWEGYVSGVIAVNSARLAPLSGVWSVHRCGGVVDSARGYMWPWAAGAAKSLSMASWVHEGDVEIRLDGKRVVWF